MLFGHSNINKAVSSLLLVILLLIHSVKLLHSHAANTFSSNEIHKHGSIVKNLSDCSICNYQLAKDIDDPFCYHEEACTPRTSISNSQLIEFYKGISYSAFESRGPPARI